jgi:hypothetical protein
MSGDMVRLLACETHGQTKWQGHVMCDDCGETYQTIEDKKPRFAPEVCRCGQRLMPPPEVAIGGDPLGKHVTGLAINADGTVEPTKPHDGDDWTARPICYLCFRKVAKKWGGRIPVEQFRGQVN